MDSEHTWVVRLDIEEIGNRTDAAATLFTDGLQTADARGTARKSPYDVFAPISAALGFWADIHCSR